MPFCRVAVAATSFLIGLTILRPAAAGHREPARGHPELATGPAKPMPITGHQEPSLKSFDDLMTSFMAEHKVPGAALAVTRGGRLVYARGFGYADVERNEPVQPASLFRIASLTKPLTGVAILQLVERGKLKLDDKVFEILHFGGGPSLARDETHAGHGGPAYNQAHLEPGAKPDPRLKQITIRQLLHHTGGWDREKSFDPMFRSVDIAKALGVPPPARQEHIIRYMMGQPLQFDPGERYAYSNFGYCLLGRAIEAITGQSYEAYVKASILAPLGITDMQIGHTLLSGRVPSEVAYYQPDGKTAPAVVGEKIGEPVPWPYGAWYLEGFDSHGGWIASAVDMVRFAAAFDDSSRCKLLKPESIQIMFARPGGLAGHNPDGSPKDAYYGCGWSVRMINGTATLLVRRHDGLCWAVMFNTHAGPDGKFLGAEIDPLVHRAADAVREWPAIDLFAK